jgi:hypothetical protein
MSELHEMAEQVNSKESFIAFVNALAADRAKEVEIEKKNPSNPYGPGACGWENVTIEACLQSMAAWASTTSAETGRPSVPEEASWRTFAKMLYAAKIYE